MKMMNGIKMLNDGFALLSKGFATMMAECEGKEAAVANSDADDTRTCTLPEAARRLGCGRSTISRLCDAGELKYTKDTRSGYRRVVVSSIAEYHRRLCEEAVKLRKAA